jgi:hypothetical protein
MEWVWLVAGWILARGEAPPPAFPSGGGAAVPSLAVAENFPGCLVFQPPPPQDLVWIGRNVSELQMLNADLPRLPPPPQYTSNVITERLNRQGRRVQLGGGRAS